MSGGVDSSVVAALAARSGAEVIGVTLQLYDHGEAVGRSQDLLRRPGHLRRQARSPSGSASPIMSSTMKAASATSVIERFADEYARGPHADPLHLLQPGGEVHRSARASPAISAPIASPPAIMSAASSAPNGAGAAPRRRSGARPELFPVRDHPRPARLSCAFRSATCPSRRCARSPASSALVVADKPDSQDICFVPDGDYAAVVEEGAARGGACRARSSIATGACSARHRGLIHFTVGQRRGLEIGGQAEPLYVLRLEPESAAGRGRAEARARGPRGAALRRQLARRGPERRADRQGPLAGAAGARRASTARASISTQPEYGVAPGQAAVLYDGDRVLGGGWIEETVAAELDAAPDRAPARREIEQRCRPRPGSASIRHDCPVRLRAPPTGRPPSRRRSSRQQPAARLGRSELRQARRCRANRRTAGRAC